MEARAATAKRSDPRPTPSPYWDRRAARPSVAGGKVAADLRGGGDWLFILYYYMLLLLYLLFIYFTYIIYFILLLGIIPACEEKLLGAATYRRDASKKRSKYTQRNLFEILLNQTEIRL